MDGARRLAPMRLGLVGLGKIARESHLPALGADGAFALSATASPDAGLDHLPAYPSFARMLAAERDLGAISICTPPVRRFDIARAAIAAGLHVMLEKPPTVTLAELDALKRQAGAAGVALFAAWHSREAAAVPAVRTWLKGRRIRAVRLVWQEDIRTWHNRQDWILAAGGFGVFDPAINAFSILTLLLTDPILIRRAGLTRPENRQMPVQASITAESGDAVIAMELDVLHQGGERWDIEIDTDGGTVVLTDGGHRAVIGGQTHTFAPVSEYANLYRRFASLITCGDSDVDGTPLALVADIMLIADWRIGERFAW